MLMKLLKFWTRYVAILTFLLAILFTSIAGPIKMTWGTTPAHANPEVPLKNIYLPLVFTPRESSIFGVEIYSATPHDPDDAGEVGSYYVRNFLFDWSLIEPENNRVYHWEHVNEARIIDIAAQQLKLIATTKWVPSWAQMYPGIYCGPVKPEYLDEYASYMGAVVARYSKPPYNVKFWEIWNEPDVDHRLFSKPPYVFGCLGNEDDPYYGGGYYAEMLKAVYPAIKAADPEAKVLIGGLLLDCDPTIDPQRCKPSKFFEGILANGGGPYFDIANYHGFAIYDHNTHIAKENFNNWSPRGGVILGKANFLREVMARYGISKPVMLTEGALKCNYCAYPDPPEGFYEAQGDYVVSLMLRTWADNHQGTIWYTLNENWWPGQYTSLIGPESKRPAFNAYKFMTYELAKATIGAQIDAYAGILGYSFYKSNKTIWVVWSIDAQPHTMPVPTNTTKVMDKYGTPISYSTTLSVNSPIYIEIAP